MPSFFSGQARKVQQAKQRKNQKYKLYAEHKRAIRDSSQPDASYQDHIAALTNAGADASPPPHQQSWQSQQGIRKKQKKHSAAAAARKQWEQKQEAVNTAREEAAAAYAQRQHEQAAARKRRADQQAKLSKRNKRGQPVLGNQVEHLLDKLLKK